MKPEHPSPSDDLPADDAHSWLSAFADGEADASQPACSLWRSGAPARRAWHAYHLIGDVMRSEELAASPARDAAFLAGLRERLAAEPVLLAPAPVSRGRRPWLVPAALVAGFAAVAGVLLVPGAAGPGLQGVATTYASASASSSGLLHPGQAQLVGAPGAAGLMQTPVSAQGFIRDPRLNEYLRVHEAARGGVVVVAPGGMLRRVDAVVPADAAR
jgi:sigma-E factor negative regulatory protein RseA